MKAMTAVDPRNQAPAEDVLAWGLSEFGNRLGIFTSFQASGMVIVDMAARIRRDVRVMTLDTGRLPTETYDLISAVRDRYGIQIELLYPDADEVSAMVSKHGPNLFYERVAYRRLCCEVRKVRPLDRKLKELDAWVTGLRREQGESREQIDKVRIDGEHDGILKLCPLADWTDQQVWDYIRSNDVPYHPLYTKGYTSIGCHPCTRPTEPGEHPRAGRWWWESGDPKECGIHFTPDGVRQEVDVLLDDVLESANRTKPFA